MVGAGPRRQDQLVPPPINIVKKWEGYKLCVLKKTRNKKYTKKNKEENTKTCSTQEFIQKVYVEFVPEVAGEIFTGNLYLTLTS